MKKGGVILVFIVILLIIGGLVVYFVFEKPKQESINILHSNVSIYAIDKETGSHIKTGYIIYVNNVTYKSGFTERGGAIREKLPINSTIKIFNNNTEGQFYYQDVHEFYLTQLLKRVQLNLVSPGELIFDKINESYIRATSEGTIDKVKFCFKWSGSLIYVKSNFSQIPRIDKYGKCYNGNITLNGTNSLEIPFEYKTFGINENYKISIIFIDSNLNNYTYQI